MRYPVLVLSVVLVSSAALLQAQRSDAGFSGGATGAFHGGPPAVSPHSNQSGPRAPEASLRGRDFHHHHGRGYGDGYGALPYGYWYDGDDWGENGTDYVNCPPDCYGPEQPPYSVNYANPVPTQPPVAAAPKPQIAFHSVSPKLQEIALPKEASAPKPTPPALFVLNNGERIESRRYLLSDQVLQIEIGRQQRTIPLSAVDLGATIAANQERGIDLIIPQGNNSLFLGF